MDFPSQKGTRSSFPGGTSSVCLICPRENGVWRLVALVRSKLMAEPQADGFYIGVNNGSAAGHFVASNRQALTDNAERSPDRLGRHPRAGP